MEQQLIDHKDSIGKIYSITAGLEQRMPDEVIFYAVEMLGKLMKTKDVALYNVVSKDYAPYLFCKFPKGEKSWKFNPLQGDDGHL